MQVVGQELRQVKGSPLLPVCTCQQVKVLFNDQDSWGHPPKLITCQSLKGRHPSRSAVRGAEFKQKPCVKPTLIGCRWHLYGLDGALSGVVKDFCTDWNARGRKRRCFVVGLVSLGENLKKADRGTLVFKLQSRRSLCQTNISFVHSVGRVLDHACGSIRCWSHTRVRF